MSSDRKAHINEARLMLLDQMRGLREVARDNPEALNTELRIAKGLCDLSQALTATARVEVDYIDAIGGGVESVFLQMEEAQPLPPPVPDVPQQPLTSLEPARRLGGPTPDHPWRGNVTRHRLVG